MVETTTETDTWTWRRGRGGPGPSPHSDLLSGGLDPERVRYRAHEGPSSGPGTRRRPPNRLRGAPGTEDSCFPPPVVRLPPPPTPHPPHPPGRRSVRLPIVPGRDRGEGRTVTVLLPSPSHITSFVDGPGGGRSINLWGSDTRRVDHKGLWGSGWVTWGGHGRKGLRTLNLVGPT